MTIEDPGWPMNDREAELHARQAEWKKSDPEHLKQRVRELDAALLASERARADLKQRVKELEVGAVTETSLRCWWCGTAAYQPNDRCDSHVAWKDRLATEQEMHTAWRKRADEAETELTAATRTGAQLRAQIEQLEQEALARVDKWGGAPSDLPQGNTGDK